MWSIAMLKENAKRMLSGYYWIALGASLIVMILAGGLLNQYQEDTVDLNSAIENYMSSGAASSGDYDFSTGEGVEEFFRDFSSGIESSEESSGSSIDEDAVIGWFESVFGEIGSMDIEKLVTTLVVIVLVAVLISMLVSFLYSLLFANPLLVGHNRFYLDARMGNAQVGNVFSQFSSGKFGNTVKTMFIYDLKIWLWGLLTIIPVIPFCISIVGTIKNAGNMDVNDIDAVTSVGMEILGSLLLLALAYGLFCIPQIIKRLSYTLVPYILAENPQMPQKRAFEISVQTMKGEKGHLFGLQCSFIGWYILPGIAGSLVSSFVGNSLGSIVTMAGFAFLYPYVYATYTEFYCCMREKAMATGIASSDELNGVFGKAAQDVPFPEQNTANTMPYQRVDNSSGTSGSYPAYPQNNVQPVQPSEPQMGVTDDINSGYSSGKISLEKKNDDNGDNFQGPDIN